MRPAEITNEQIIEAGQALQIAGRNITGFALRQMVGGGNPRRLKQVWDEYQASHSVVSTEPVAELPVEVAEQLAHLAQAWTERLTALAVDLNDKAVKTAERRVTEAVRSAGMQREQAERELVDAAQTVEDMEQLLEVAQERIIALDQQLEAGRINQQTQAVELAQLWERLAAQEHASKTSAEAARIREAELQAKLEDALQAVQLVREREAQAQGQLKAAKEQHAQDNQTNAELRASLAAAQEGTNESRGQLAAVQARLEESAKQIEIQTKTATNAQAQAAKAAAEAAELRGELKALRQLVEQERQEKPQGH